MKPNARYRYRVGVATLLFLLAAPGLHARLDERCTVSVLNRNIQVNHDGSWVLPNVPANLGQVRARATCIRNGATLSGESDYFTLPPNGIVNLPEIILGATHQVPVSLGITPGPVSFTAAGETSQLTVAATYPDGSVADVTAAGAGTSYTTSNPALVTVGANGLLTAVASGTVVIQAINEGAAGLTTATVVLSSTDSDDDGLADDVESANGLDPNNPVDAFEDPDRDGLTNREEIVDFGTDLRKADTDGDGIQDGEEVIAGADGFVTNALLADTDGDGIRDGLEVETGSNPLDPASYNLAAALSSLEVSPGTFVITFNSILAEAFRQLTVTGILRDQTTIDLTSRARATSYVSSDLSVCSFGAEDGRIFAGNTGSCTITVANSGFSTQSDGAVRTFTPTALSFVAIPGFANNVDVAGDYAYVAAGAAGLQVVDVSNRQDPRIVGSLDTPGQADDVKIIGNTVLLADGSAGLALIDVTDPAHPVSLGSLDTPGEAQDVCVNGNLAYVADGAQGLQVIDISDPSSPAIVGSMATRGTAKGVDVSAANSLVAIAEGDIGIEAADISNPASPHPRGLVSTGDARDVILSGSLAFVADFSSSFTSVDLADTDHPVVRASTPRSTGGLLMDVARAGSFAFGADVFFVNGVPIINVSDPASPVPRAILDFGSMRDDNGTGIAVDGGFVYLTAALGIIENGITGDSRLYIGQYLVTEDSTGAAPTVRITQPAAGQSVIETQQVLIAAEATDDVAVATVSFLVNGSVVFTDDAAPYEYLFDVPVGAGTLMLEARAFDFGGNAGNAEPVVIHVASDLEAPLVRIASPPAGEVVLEGSTLRIVAEASDNVAVAAVEFLVDGGLVSRDTSTPYEHALTVPVGVSTITLGARATDRRGNVGHAEDVAVGIVPGGDLNIEFSPAVHYQAGQGPISLALDDLDGDGDEDLAVGSVSTPSSVLPGNGDGTFARALDVPCFLCVSVATGAFNGDGARDLVFGREFDSLLEVFLGAGNGSFGSPAFVSAGGTAISVAVGRFDADDVDDLAVANLEDVSILLGAGDGTFPSANGFDAGSNSPGSVAIGDFNNDGHEDLVLGGNGFFSASPNAFVTVLLGNGDGTFGSPIQVPTGSGPNRVAVSDLDHDGNQDLVVANGFSDDVSVVPGHGDGTFSPERRFAVGELPLDVTVADFNVDGKEDIAVAGYMSGVTVLLGLGSQSFSPPIGFVTGGNPTAIVTADFNSDGRPDLAVSNYFDVSVLLNRTGLSQTNSVSANALACVERSRTNAIGVWRPPPTRSPAQAVRLGGENRP